ncbi:hypothetical protein GCM10022246_17780 [Pedobacter ginsengiterrae]|uniref:WD40-like Beta Propeller Repeat n=2 Tax=Pedobacter ginsengiterrae TaxID=871696 RepID=A0ABP7PG94_9SPHI
MGDFYKTTPYPVYPSVAASGNLYYSSGNAKDSEIYLARKTESGYGSAEKLSFNLSSERDIDPVISPDETFIIFSSSTRKGMGGSDLWVSFYEQGKWEEPINLGKAINSPTNEGQAALSHDGKRLYFTSIRNKSQLRGPRERKINQQTFDQEFKTIFNGIPNIWVADISNLRVLGPAH